MTSPFDPREISGYPTGKVPENALRQLLWKNAMKYEIVMEFVAKGFTSVAKFAALGADEAAVGHKLRGRPAGTGVASIAEILDPSVWSAGAQKEAEIITIMTIWAVCKTRQKKLSDLEVVAYFNSEAPPIQIPPEEKQQDIEKLNSDYPDLQLTNETCPHFDLWDDIGSQFARSAFKYIGIGMVRVRSEDVGKKSRFQLDFDESAADLTQLIFKTDGTSIAAAKIENVADCMFRFKVLWILFHLVCQYAIRKGLKIYAR